MKQSTIESVLREKLGEIRDSAMELSAQLEFSPIDDVTDNDLWKWATKLVRDAEEIMKNSRGELSVDGVAAEEADFEQVADRLRKDAGLNAEVVATGGGIDCIRITCGQYALYFGTAGENWGFSVSRIVGEDEEFDFNDCDAGIVTDASSENPDASAVALAITKAAMEFDQKYCATK